MPYTVTNLLRQAVPVHVFNKEGKLEQYNLSPRQTIKVNKVSTIVENLVDRDILRVTEVPAHEPSKTAEKSAPKADK